MVQALEFLSAYNQRRQETETETDRRTDMNICNDLYIITYYTSSTRTRRGGSCLRNIL